MPKGLIYNSYFYRDWRNADRFKPNVTPPRQKFNGFVEFVFNPEVVSSLGGDSSAFRTQISSLVQTAKIPQISFNTVTKKQYNMKRIVQTGVEFGPCTISVIDTVANEWLAIFMRYFSYHYNEPRNRTTAGAATDRDSAPKQWNSNQQTTTRPSTFLTDSFPSNNAGYDITRQAHFIDHIKIINYAGGKGVEYILFRPQITSFDPGDLDYTDSGFRTFDIEFEIENMTVNRQFNFEMNEQDLARFDNSDIEFPFDWRDQNTKEGFAYNSIDNAHLGGPNSPRGRTGQ